ncbi:hypothetical protein RJ640_008648 [Escallonia rubra]|uniref:Btz domain-containing protein n=1 Tax=Escallonia rubra TaxID=112253 RepID=A0AA88UKH0_9ASTE|nr:hypothetical protein RJ640_008648 [Escallonia rubra]
MASAGEEDVEYESDPEEAKRLLTTRRREASDDEADEEEDEREAPLLRSDSRAGVGSDSESDGQGAAEEYEDEESEVEEEEEDDVAPAVVGLVPGDGGSEGQLRSLKGRSWADEEKKEDEAMQGGRGRGRGKEGEGEGEGEEDGGDGEGEKKENEPFAVPTAGAFYMHDDRFRDSVGGRNRRTLGGRKLWESKDDRKWGHDKFEELSIQDRHYDEGRRVPRGRYRGRGKNRGEDRGFPRGNRSKAYNDNNQNNAPKAVRGRGPRRYQPSMKNGVEALAPHRQSGKSVDTNSYGSSGRVSAPTSSVDSDPVPARKQGFASSLSSASPPFYPSAASGKEVSSNQKRDSQAAPINRDLRSSMPQSNTMRGKNVVDTIGMEKLYIDGAITGKPFTNLQMPPPGSSLTSSSQASQSRVQGRGPTPLGHMPHTSTASHNQVNRASPPTQLHSMQRAPLQNRLQPSLQASGQQLGQRPGSGSQASSPPKAALSVNSFESGEMDSPPESSKSKTALVGKGKGSIQGSGRGSFPFGASGNMGGGHGDMNFPATPAFLPVMQFGGQHPGGIPAVGMAFPGYVAQPQHGVGNSEMTWYYSCSSI